ncbi:MAG TPA: hypothetical protein VFW92_03910, partial [Candidatus Limnocylindrales bacterium]|nr:hypothetical protein [Candidatus Limnocylindrales bacterium]
LNIDIFAHLGGLIAGAWLGLVIPPLAPTIRTAFIRPGEGAPGISPRAGILQTVGVLAVVGAVVVGVIVGTPLRRDERPYFTTRSGPAVGASIDRPAG